MKKVFIPRDSIIKHVKSHSLWKSLDNSKIYVKDFSCARVRSMQAQIMLDVGTNDLVTNIPTKKVAEPIIDLVYLLKSNSFSVAISSITVRNDRYWKKEGQVKRHLKTLCNEGNLELISREKKITENHLNGSKLHLNKAGRAVLSNTFNASYLKLHLPTLFYA